MNWISKNLLLVIVAFLIVVFAGSFTYFANAADNWDIKINTLSGNQNVLDNINIDGIVLDNVLALHFNLINGEASQSLIKNQKVVNSLYATNGEHTWDRLTTDLAQYEMNFMGNSGMNISIGRRLFDKNNYFSSYDRVELISGFRSNSSKSIETPIIESEDNLPDNETNGTKNGTSNSATNSAQVTEKQGITINVNSHVTTMQELDGKLYFLIPKLRDFSGNSGLYVVDKFERNSPYAGVRKLLEIPLNGGENEMIALGKVDNKLCLIRKNTGKISIQIYNAEKQAFEEEYTDFIVSGKNTQNDKQNGLNKASGSNTQQNGTQDNEQLYAIYSSPGHISIVVNGEAGFDFYTYSFQGEIKRVNTVKGFKGDEGMRKFSLFYLNDYLYIIQNEIVWAAFVNGTGQYQRNPDELIYIIAYSNSGDMVFKGELDARQNDDNIRQSKYSEKIEEDNKYSYIPYRRFLKIEISTSPKALN